MSSEWPALPYERWSATCDTLHAHTQVLGKLAATLAPPEPQLQHAALRLSARGWETLPLPTGGRIAARRVLLYGLGSVADLDGQRLRFAHHEMVRAVRNLGYRRLAVLRMAPLRTEDLAAVVEGCVLGTWEQRSRQTGARPAQIEELYAPAG